MGLSIILICCLWSSCYHCESTGQLVNRSLDFMTCSKRQTNRQTFRGMQFAVRDERIDRQIDRLQMMVDCRQTCRHVDRFQMKEVCTQVEKQTYDYTLQQLCLIIKQIHMQSDNVDIHVHVQNEYSLSISSTHRLHWTLTIGTLLFILSFGVVYCPGQLFHLFLVIYQDYMFLTLLPIGVLPMKSQRVLNSGFTGFQQLPLPFFLSQRCECLYFNLSQLSWMM